MFKSLLSTIQKKMCLLILINFISSIAFSQYNISGKIISEKNLSLIGASIFVKQNKIGTTANNKAEYKLENLSAGQKTIIVSFIGYKTIKKNVLVDSNMKINFVMEKESVMTNEISVLASRADHKTPIAFVNVSKESLHKQNLGQDIPILLSITPSFIVSSDAGAGVGYTGFRIRGSGASRTNITVDGIPFNDSESHGVYLVNMPDLTSSLQDVQIQRGVGTSAAGSGAFGASINMKTQSLSKKPYSEIHSSYGSFNTFKNTLKVGTGIRNGFVFDVRLSKITSDGFIDRAKSNLQSAYISAAYLGEKTSIRANMIVGKEKTYQAWGGVPKVRLNNDIAGMTSYRDTGLYTQDELDHMLESNSRTYNKYTYKNETDNYWQKHYRLFLTHILPSDTKLKVALHYTKGEGYYEQFKKDDKLKKYGLKPIVIGDTEIKKTDVIRRKWLDNDFYGTVLSLSKSLGNTDVVLGAAANRYDGDHLGELIWMKNAGNSFLSDKFYDNNGTKDDYSAYVKVNSAINSKLNLFLDLQVRAIDYSIKGIDSDLKKIDQDHDFRFFNPKMGFNWLINTENRFFASFSVANREPNRSNYVDATRSITPTSERLLDYELSYKYNTDKLALEANIYYMDYKNQLVLTGGVNDVGSALMTNVKDSYRAGIELSASVKIINSLKWNSNISLSRNRIKNFTSWLDDWNPKSNYSIYIGNTNIAMSPNISANSIFAYNNKGFSAQFISQYVGKQYIDNTSSDQRSLDAYCISKLNVSYEFTTKIVDKIKLNFLVNNIFNKKYESNAWVYRFRSGDVNYTMDGYFPQAGINFLTGVSLIF